MNSRRMTAAWLALVVVGASDAAAQRCADERSRIGSIGVERFGAEQVELSGRDGRWTWLFGAEPVVERVRDHGQRGDALQPGDVLVAVDGHLITTREGGRRLGAVVPGERVEVQVRRNGQPRTLAVVAGEMCIPRPPAPPAPAPAGAPPAPPAAPAAPAPRSGRAAPPAPAPQAPRAPDAPPPAPAPPPLSRVHLGFSFVCSHCQMESSGGPAGARVVWSFEEPPELTAVEEGGPAWRAGLRTGDRLLALDGHDLTTREGGERLGALTPGQRVTWTYARGGRTGTAVMRAESPPARGPRSDAPRPPAGPDSPLRYSGRLGDTLVEARGAPVSVVEDPATGEIVVRSGEVWVRVRVLPPEDRQEG